MSKLKSIGRATVVIMSAMIAPLVGRDELADRLGYTENAGAPTSMTPEYVGQWVFDTTNLQWYVAVSTTLNGWAAFGSPGGGIFKTQAAPAAKTTSATLTAAELLTGMITGNQGAAGTATYTLPLGADIETALLAINPGLKVNDAVDFSVINISTNAAETVTIAANTGVTVVGDVTLAAVAVGDQSSGMFRLRRTAANTYVCYRVA
jgi:hypothetical protein